MEITNLNGESYVLTSFLQKHGVNEQTIYNGLSRNRNQKSKHYDHYKDPVDQRLKWIRYRSIPLNLFKRYQLPSHDQLLEQSVKNEDSKIHELIIRTLQFAYDIEYKKYLKTFHGAFYERSLIESYAKTNSVIISVLKLKQMGVSIKRIFPVYQSFINLQFESKSITSFYAKLKTFEQLGHRTLIHKSIGLTKSGTKITESHRKEIIRLYKDSKQYSGREIHEKTNIWAIREGFSQISISSIKKILCDPYVQNQCKPFRNGAEWKTLFLDPFKLRKEPEFNGTLWQLDGSRVQIPFLSKKNKLKFLNLFVIMDVRSRKIIGYSTDESENHKMVIEAIKNAVETTKYLPVEMVIDNGTCFKHETFKKLEEHIGFLGTNVRRHAVGSPRDKGHVERFFSTFQTTICKNIVGYIGEGVKSKREQGRPSRKVIKESTSLKNLRSKIDLEHLIDDLIIKYNSLQINDSRPNPNVKFEVSHIDKTVSYVSENEFALMFWDKTTIQVKNSMLLLSEGSLRNKRFQYIIENEELRLSLNLTNVKVCFQKGDRSIIKLFDNNLNWITDLKLSNPVNTVVIRKKTKPSLLPDYSFDDSNKPSRKTKKRSFVDSNSQVFKQPASFDVLFLKTKGNE